MDNNHKIKITGGALLKKAQHRGLSGLHDSFTNEGKNVKKTPGNPVIHKID